MKIVDLQDPVALILDKSWHPFQVLTARAAFHHMMTANERVRPIDINAVEFSRADWLRGYAIKNEIKIPVTLSENHPCLRSAHDVWPVPTVVVITDRFVASRLTHKGKRMSLKKSNNGRARKRGAMSRIELCRKYKFTCQYCFKKFHYDQLNIDHIYPRDKGGSNHGFNLTLSCIQCNSRKANHYPVTNIKGDVPKGTAGDPPYLRITDDELSDRPEWEKHLYT